VRFASFVRVRHKLTHIAHLGKRITVPQGEKIHARGEIMTDDPSLNIVEVTDSGSKPGWKEQALGE
jgi:hypothetical protein